jgi:hypothetical protein
LTPFERSLPAKRRLDPRTSLFVDVPRAATLEGAPTEASAGEV